MANYQFQSPFPAASCGSLQPKIRPPYFNLLFLLFGPDSSASTQTLLISIWLPRPSAVASWTRRCHNPSMHLKWSRVPLTATRSEALCGAIALTLEFMLSSNRSRIPAASFLLSPSSLIMPSRAWPRHWPVVDPRYFLQLSLISNARKAWVWHRCFQALV